MKDSESFVSQQHYVRCALKDILKRIAFAFTETKVSTNIPQKNESVILETDN
jgi:hypothetical protein